MDPNLTLERVLRLARLDTAVFDEVRDDPREMVPSLVVAAVSCLLAGLGVFLWWRLVPDVTLPDDVFINTVILGPIFLFVSLYIGVAVCWLILGQVFRVEADLQAMARAMGYAACPLAVSLAMFIPVLWPVLSLVPLALLFVMMIYATQATTTAESNQVVMAATGGFVAIVLVAGLIATLGDAAKAPMGAGQFGVLFDLA